MSTRYWIEKDIPKINNVHLASIKEIYFWSFGESTEREKKWDRKTDIDREREREKDDSKYVSHGDLYRQEKERGLFYRRYRESWVNDLDVKERLTYISSTKLRENVLTFVRPFFLLGIFICVWRVQDPILPVDSLTLLTNSFNHGCTFFFFFFLFLRLYLYLYLFLFLLVSVIRPSRNISTSCWQIQNLSLIYVDHSVRKVADIFLFFFFVNEKYNPIISDKRQILIDWL